MSLTAADVGILGDLGTALGLFESDGSPDPTWFQHPETALGSMLADDGQRAALLAFVDEALGGGERDTDAAGVIWLPIVEVDGLTVSVTIAETPAGIDIGLGLVARTTVPISQSSLSLPLFRTRREGGPAVDHPLLLGTNSGRIRAATSITVDTGPPVPGEACLGAIGIDVEVPTAPSDPLDAVFGLSMLGFQLPGADKPRDLRVSADGVDDLDDAVLDLVLSLVRSSAESSAVGSVLASLAGLLGLLPGDNVADFPIGDLADRGVQALADWMLGIVTTTAARTDWLAHVANLLGGTVVGESIEFDIGGAADLTVGIHVDTGPTGNTRLTPTLGVVLGTDDARIELTADLFEIDLVTGSAVAFPRLGAWAAVGRPGAGNRVLDIAGPPIARADTLRIGFDLDQQRRLTFVLAADGVVIGTHEYPTLDLTSTDAVMDAVGDTVEDIAGELLGELGDAIDVARTLLGLTPPPGVPGISLADLLIDPVGAVGDYWHDLVGAADADAAMKAVLAELRDAVADSSTASASIKGTGTPLDPWRVQLLGPLELEASVEGDELSIGIAARTSIDTLGERCTVVDTRLAATIATVDLSARTASLLPGVAASLSTRERGVDPPRVSIELPGGLGGIGLIASGVGLRLGWTPATGLSAAIDAPGLTLVTPEFAIPITMPTIAADGSVTLPADAWDAVEMLVGHLVGLLGGPLEDAVRALGWATAVLHAGGEEAAGARLRLADLVDQPADAIAGWLGELAFSELGSEAMGVVADLFGGSGAARGVIVGTGHPVDPYRFALDDALPNVALWFPPEGLEPRHVSTPGGLQRWRPGDPALSPQELGAALAAEAEVATDVRALIDGRDIVAGLSALTARWAGGDGRISPPTSEPDGVVVVIDGVAAGQLFDELDIEDLIGRAPGTTIHVALGANAWADAPADRRVDLTTPGLDAAMFAAPDAADGDWFVALGSRAACVGASATGDGTVEQAARLASVLDALATVSTDIVVVALAGAGHAARLAADDQPAVTDLVTLGTPLAPIALSALTTQPTADAIRLLDRLLVAIPAVEKSAIDDDDLEEPDGGPSIEADDEDLALGRALVGSMIELTTLADPTADLRIAATPPAAPRAGLDVYAVFGAVESAQVGRAITAIVAAGLAERARTRALEPSAPATGAGFGLRFVVADSTEGALAISGDALLTLAEYDRATGFDRTPRVRVRMKVADRTGWLVSTPDLELRAVSADVSLTLDGTTSGGRATVTLHDARVFGQSWERLVIGTDAGGVVLPVVPEAQTLLAAAIQRVSVDIDAAMSAALEQFLRAMGLVADAGGLAVGAIDQLVHDPAALICERLASHAADMSAAVATLLGPVGAAVDLAAQTVRLVGGGDLAGRFGWQVDVTLAPSGLSGQVRIGPDAPIEPSGAIRAVIDIATSTATPLVVRLDWHRPGGATEQIAVWPDPDPATIARGIAAVAPSLGGQAALEMLRRADDGARAIIDAALDALGLLSGTIGDASAHVRPIAGLLADPAGWLRSAGSIGAEPQRLQTLFDALRPLLGLPGAPGEPLALATGVTLAAGPAGGGARIELAVDSTGWIAPGGVAGRLVGGLTAILDVGLAGPPRLGVGVHLGLDGAASGRRAVHMALGAGGTSVFIRPTSGSDIALIPFAGLGSFSDAAAAALPFLLDQLALISGDVGAVVGTVGDALGLRAGPPLKFDGDRLAAWGIDPVGALTLALPSILTTGLTTIAPQLDSILPTGVAVTATGNDISVTVGDVTATWDPVVGRFRIRGDGIAVPGLDQLSFAVAISAIGLDELTVTVGPISIDAEGVELQPFVTVAAGATPPGGRRVMVGLAVDDTSRFAARWLLDTGEFSLVASDGAIVAGVDTVDPVAVSLRIVEVIADLVVGVAMQQDAVTDLLDTSLGAGTVRDLLEGVVLADGDTSSLIDELFDLDTLLGRFQRLLRNLGSAGVSIGIDDFTLAYLTIGGVVGMQVDIANRFALLEGDIALWLENDDSWIDDNPSGSGGLFVGFLTTAPLAFAPTLVVNGLGLRIGNSTGPLLDAGITLDSLALHLYAAIDGSGPRSGGIQLQLSNLAVGTGGAKGDNGIAQGILSDSGPQPPAPAFSPGLAIQKHGSGPVGVALRAGDGDGPWWIAIQKGFGPLYLEQIGFGTEMASGRLSSISLLMDGSVSMFGLTCTVDDLSITYFVSNGDFFDPSHWAVDLAGLAVSADMAGLAISGGLLKQTSDQGIEYLGMLLARFGVYGITIYGGYGEGVQDGEKFTAFFAVGAINGPIGGPPAFFLTGIGGGFGINRALIVPTDLSKFGDYPLIQALDIAATPDDPMQQLRALGAYFPMEKGTFWFAAGIAFTSFALVDGIAVVAVEVGDGLDINLLGLARMALPRPQVALVSIEVALIVRFSSSEGVLWVQGQLTDNSWLLYPEIKLTGGFAFVIWFKGEHRGEFVLTLGGYHPDFHRDGYPVVPRLGLRWSIGSSIVIEAGSYFALTSEALMAGGDFHASATFGPGWADVKFGAHGIVYFDPFQYAINVYARISAGITIDLWIFGEVSFSISIGARIDVTGPDFHGKATFEIGPIELSVEFGGSDKSDVKVLLGPDFVDKYLENSETGTGALAHAAMTAFGGLPSKGDESTPDGTAARPFVVVVEFGLTFTSTVPITTVRVVTKPGETSSASHLPSGLLGVAPMGMPALAPTLELTWRRIGGGTETFPFEVVARPKGAFPSGVWGPPLDMDNRKVPKAEMIDALNELDLVATASESGGGPEIPYHQVEIGERHPLPFSRRPSDIATLKTNSAALAGLIDAPTTVAEAFGAARVLIGQTASATSLAAMRGERQAPPMLGTLAEGLDIDAITVVPEVAGRPPGKIYDHFVDAPIVVGLLSGASVDLRTSTPALTTVEGSARAWRTAPPTMAAVDESRSRSIAARVVVRDDQAVSTRQKTRSSRRRAAAAPVTVIGSVGVPPSTVAHAAPAIVRGAGAHGVDQLDAFTSSLGGRRLPPRVGADGRSRATAPTPGATLFAGQTVVMKLPNARADVGDGDRPRLGVTGAAARVVVLTHGGAVLTDTVAGGAAADTIVIEQGAERIVAIGQGESSGPNLQAGLAGWHGGMQLPYVGWTTALAPGCVVRSLGEPLALHDERRDAGWIEAAELTRGVSIVTTRFSDPVTTVVIVIDDPAAFGDPIDGRQLVLGLDGAERVTDAAGQPLEPVVLAAENRSVLAYAVAPTRDGAVVVTIASERGWSLVGVMGASTLSAEGAVALVSTRGLDAALQPFATGANGVARLAWAGPSRTDAQRSLAKALASGRPGVRLAAATPPRRTTKKAAPKKATTKKAGAPRSAGKRTTKGND